jgi:hypothetical protein
LLTSLVPFKVAENLDQYTPNLTSQDLIKSVKERLTPDEQVAATTNEAQILAQIANQAVLKEHSQSALRDNNWIFYLDYDKTLPINEKLPVSIELNKETLCTQPSCQPLKTNSTEYSSPKQVFLEYLIAYFNSLFPFFVLSFLIYFGLQIINLKKLSWNFNKVKKWFSFGSSKIALNEINFDKQNFFR